MIRSRPTGRSGGVFLKPGLQHPTYIFLDEGGNFDFSSNGTPYFTLTSVACARPFAFEQPLNDLRYDWMERGIMLERFHASDDRQRVRDDVFAIIREHLQDLRIDTIVVEKRKTHPNLQDAPRFYPLILGYLMKYVLDKVSTQDGVIVITDTIPVAKHRRAVEKAVKQTLAEALPEAIRYQIVHHDSRSAAGLQVADYCNWAVHRRWTTKDDRSRSLIRGSIRSEFDIFANGQRYYY